MCGREIGRRIDIEFPFFTAAEHKQKVLCFGTRFDFAAVHDEEVAML